MIWNWRFRLAWIKKLASPRCLHIGPIANRGFSISQPLPHLQQLQVFQEAIWISIMANQVWIEFIDESIQWTCITGPKPIENSVKHPPACWPCHIPADLQDMLLNPESGSCQTQAKLNHQSIRTARTDLLIKLIVAQKHGHATLRSFMIQHPRVHVKVHGGLRFPWVICHQLHGHGIPSGPTKHGFKLGALDWRIRWKMTIDLGQIEARIYCRKLEHKRANIYNIFSLQIMNGLQKNNLQYPKFPSHFKWTMKETSNITSMVPYMTSTGPENDLYSTQKDLYGLEARIEVLLCARRGSCGCA